MAAVERRITIRDPRTGNSCEICVENDHTMREILKVIVTEFNLQSDNYFITRYGAVLNPDEKVSSTGIVEGDELIISPDPVGGARLPEPIWKIRLNNEMNDIEGLAFYSSTYQDNDTPDRYRTINVKLVDAPAYKKVTENSQPILSTEHELEIKLNRDYPDSPPQIRFISSIFHPNVYRSDQRVCIGMLNEWQDTFKVFQLIQAVDYLLSVPNLEDPADAEAVTWYESNPIQPPSRPWYKRPPRIVSQPRIVKGPRIVR